MQIFLVILILMLAIGYAAWRIYKSLTAPSDPCKGCDGCALKKKSGGKFCQSE
ncbi:MAG: FeoB-associated Cys-rich membrane protein [Prevotella sp.]|nr:FeoB-associated Cys-rich membrane protein [Prevotella sp.]